MCFEKFGTLSSKWAMCKASIFDSVRLAASWKLFWEFRQKLQKRAFFWFSSNYLRFWYRNTYPGYHHDEECKDCTENCECTCCLKCTENCYCHNGVECGASALNLGVSTFASLLLLGRLVWSTFTMKYRIFIRSLAGKCFSSAVDNRLNWRRFDFQMQIK